jgi:hypothetical protein
MKSITKLNTRGFAHVFLFLLVVVVVGIVGAWYVVSSKADTISFTLLGTHPQAAAQTTSNGKRIGTLKAFNGKIYAGFGDYNANTGPIAITPFDPATNSFVSSPEVIQGTQMIGTYRTINGKLYSPSIDVRGANFAAGDLSNGSLTWKQYAKGVTDQQGPAMIHVFDINTLTGTDIWIAGSSGSDATLFRSTDGGTTWTEMLRIAGDATTYHRFYSIVVLNSKLYVQPFDVLNGSVQTAGSSRVYSNGTWSTGPKLTTGYNVWDPEQIAGKVVYFNWALVDGVSPQCLTVFNGSSLSTSCPSGTTLTNYNVVDNTLYALGLNGKIYSTTDLITWYEQGTAPYGTSSITAMNGKIYVGTVDSKLYSAPINANPSSTTGTTTTTGGTCTGKKCGGTTGGGSTTCNGKKCQTASGAQP